MQRGSEEHSLMFSCKERSLLDELVVKSLLFLVFEIKSIDSNLVLKYERLRLQGKHVLVLLGLRES